MTEWQTDSTPEPFSSGEVRAEPSEAPAASHNSDPPVVISDAAAEQPVVEADSTAADVRARVLGQFEVWLDRMLSGEPPPEGLPEDLLAEFQSTAGRPATGAGDADLYTVFSALTTLGGEIRLQGRAFKQLTDALTPLSVLPRGIEELQTVQRDVADRMDLLADQMQSSAEEAAESSLPAPKQMLAVLMDLYDRLHRSRRVLESAAGAARLAAPRGFRKWLAGSDTAKPFDSLQSVLEGFALTLTRLEDAFSEWGVERIGRTDEPFDPARMSAIEIGPANGVPEGTVLDVYRTGYSIRGSVLAPAQVKVARENRLGDHSNG